MTPGVWKDGRVLKPEQRRRKQERDRAAKRSAAQSRDEYVRDLEMRLWGVTSRLGALEIELTCLQNLNDCTTGQYLSGGLLAGPPAQIQGLEDGNNTHTDGFAQPLWCFEQGNESAQWCSYPAETSPDLNIAGIIAPTLERPSELQSRGFIGDCEEFAMFPLDLTTAPMNPSHPSDPDSYALLPANGLEMTQEFEEAIAISHSLSGSRQIRTDHEINEDFLIRAVFHGWEEVFRFEYGRTCPLWTLLCRIDKALYENCCEAIRLAHLRVIYRMFMFIAFKRPVPKWLTPKARSYQFFPGNLISIVDFIAQPEIRNRLQRKHLTNDFWSWFSKCITFNCHLDRPQIYYYADGLYRFSKTFTDHFEEIGNWELP